MTRCTPNRPWLTALLALLSLGLFLAPELTARLTMTRAGGGALTGHFVHWSANHLVWDVLTLALLAGWLERRDRWLLVRTLALAMPLVAAAWWWLTALPTYRGLSGLDCALYAALALTLTRDRPWLGWTLLGLAAAKTAWEIATGMPLFATSGDFVPVPAAHLAGLLAGALAAIAPRTLAPRTASASPSASSARSPAQSAVRRPC